MFMVREAAISLSRPEGGGWRCAEVLTTTAGGWLQQEGGQLVVF